MGGPRQQGDERCPAAQTLGISVRWAKTSPQPCYVLNTISRRSLSDEAMKQFMASPFFGAWDPAVLQVYVQTALYDDPKGGVSLKMPGMQVRKPVEHCLPRAKN